MKNRSALTFRLFFSAIAIAIALPTHAAAPDDWRKVRSAALKASRSDLASEREAAFDSFRQQDHREAAEFLIKTITSPNTELQLKRHARDVLATFRAEECREVLYRLLRSNPDKSHLLLEAFAGMEDERGNEIGRLAIRAGVADKRRGTPIIAAGIRCLVSRGKPSDAAIGSIIKRTAEDQAIAVRKASADALLKIRTPAAIETLIALVDDAAIGKRARSLMVQLAGEDVGANQSDWKTWWEAKNATPPGSEPVSSARAAELIAEKTAAAVAAGEVPEAITFYGVPIEGKNIVFVLDASTSMRGYPLEKLKEECRSLVAQLPETHKFALVFYPKNESFPQELHLADEKTKKKAYEFINKRQVIRGTPTGDAMEFAYRRYVVGQNVDSIYLLSDGQPTKPIPDVIQKIDNLNIGVYVRINTIFIGKVPVPDPAAPAVDPNAAPNAPIKGGAAFLKEVARRHSGTFNIVEAEN